MTFNEEKYAERKRLIADIKRRPLSQLIGQRTKLKRAAKDRYTGLCPFHSEKTASFNVYDAKASYHCYGCSAHGDAIKFLRDMDNLNFIAALQDAAAFYGLAADRTGIRRRQYEPVEAVTPEDDATRIARDLARAKRIWKSGGDANGTAVEAYLRDRKIIPEFLPDGKIPPTLRYVARLEYYYQKEFQDSRGKWSTKPALLGKFPAMVAPLQDCVTREMRGLHITYLNPLAAGKLNRTHPDDPSVSLPAKKMIGIAWGCAIRLGAAAVDMAASEGIENALCAMMCGAPVCWAAASIGNLCGRGLGEGLPHPRLIDRKLPSVYPDMASAAFSFPPGTKTGLMIRDHDCKDQESADKIFERGLRRWQQQGIVPLQFIPDIRMDINDMVRAGLLAPGAMSAGGNA